MTILTTAPLLPATTLASYCYYFMFSGCTRLTTAPELPATTLAEHCYLQMFNNCTSLTTTPRLPATTLKRGCYYGMFQRCKSLITAPELPAKSLASDCYSCMFEDCTNLTTAPALPAKTLASSCYFGMFRGCTSLTTTPRLPATTLKTGCYDSMFQRCKSLTTSPELPATTLANSCYGSMFGSCTNLTTAPALPATALADSCYHSMFHMCSSLTTAPELPATTLASNCYLQMFSNCISLTTAPELPAKTLASDCYLQMFRDCTNLTTAPILPAKTLVTGCYKSTFYECSRLNHITCYATTNITIDNLENWVYGVNGTGTFTGDPSSYWKEGDSGVPTGWSSNVKIFDIHSNNTIGIYVDDFLNSAPLSQYIDDPESMGCNQYEYTGNTINYNNNTYYIWERTDGYYNEVRYALTTTVDYNTLNQQSLNYSYKNLEVHPVKYFFNDSMEEYSTCENQVIVCVNNSNNHLTMYVDDFMRGDIVIQDFINDPGAMGCNYYEYCEPFEYDNKTYYIWERTDGSWDNIKYLLTSTIDFNTLQSYSLKESIANLGTCPIDAYLSDDLQTTYSENQRNDNIVKVVRLSYYSSAGTLGMYIDDFLIANPNDFIEDPIGNDCNAYEYTGNTISYDGGDYYVWKNMGYMSSNGRGGSSNKCYALTSIIDQNTLQQKSLEYSLSNLTEYPIYTYLYWDGNEYSSGQSYNIVSVSQTTGLEMWIDDDFDRGWQDGGYSDMEEYLNWYLNNIDEAGGRHYYYIDTFEYNGGTYYLWCCYIDNRYVLTNTNDATTLTSYSIESNHSNVNTHPIITFLNKDLTEYGRPVSTYSIVKVTSSQPKQMMYVDDFIYDGIDLNSFINNPESSGCNYYEYCEPFEYNNNTYYVWMYLGPDNYIDDFAKYVLTDTIDLQTLQSYSLESSLSNIGTRPIVAYFNSDMAETYPAASRMDNIVKVFEL